MKVQRETEMAEKQSEKTRNSETRDRATIERCNEKRKWKGSEKDRRTERERRKDRSTMPFTFTQFLHIATDTAKMIWHSK